MGGADYYPIRTINHDHFISILKDGVYLPLFVGLEVL